MRHKGLNLVAVIVSFAILLLPALALNVTAAEAQLENGVGSASARGSDPDADLGGATVTASYSAITNCDAAQSTRPFIVRWTQGSTTNTFRKTGAADTSTCRRSGTRSINEGTATGLVNGSTPATVEWGFADGSALPGPDIENITVTPYTGDVLTIGGAPQPLSGTPGGVWVFGELPWPLTLSGAEVFPGLGDPDGTGSASLQLDPVQGRVCWEIHVSNITLPAFGTHIHAAPAGMSGLIVVTLSPPDSSGLSVGCTEGVDSALIEDIISSPEQFYVDVHTTDRPAGAVRGQLG